MNVLLLYPEAPSVFFSLTHTLGVLGKRAIIPPLGLLTVAALLPDRWEKRLVDLRVQPLTDEDLRWADLAMISLTAAGVQDESALQAISRCKGVGLRVVAGGVGFMHNDDFFAGQMEVFNAVDHFILGEAELALPPFLADLTRGETKRVYRAGGFSDITQSPIPMWELLDLDAYMEMCIQHTRGCAYFCDFCVVPVLMGRPARGKKTAQFLAELTRLYELGWRGFIEMNDDNLIADIKYAKMELLPALARWQKERGTPYHLHVCVDVRLGEDEELLALMREAGFHSVFLGIENLNPASLREVHKNVNINKDMRAIVERIHRAGILVYCGLMVGFDSDVPEVFQQLIDFTEECGIIVPSLTKVNAVPGAPLYDRLLAAGRIDSRYVPGVAYATNIRGLPMGDDVLDEGYARVMRHLWSPESFYKRVRRVLELSPEPLHTDKPTVANLKIAASILLHVGLLAAPERAEFWRLFTWTLRHRPHLLPIFMSAPALGYGFRRRTEELFGASYRPKRRRFTLRSRAQREEPEVGAVAAGRPPDATGQRPKGRQAVARDANDGHNRRQFRV